MPSLRPVLRRRRRNHGADGGAGAHVMMAPVSAPASVPAPRRPGSRPASAGGGIAAGRDRGAGPVAAHLVILDKYLERLVRGGIAATVALPAWTRSGQQSRHYDAGDDNDRRVLGKLRFGFRTAKMRVNIVFPVVAARPSNADGRATKIRLYRAQPASLTWLNVQNPDAEFPE